MKTKKPLPDVYTHNSTQFVASTSIDVVMRELEKFPRLTCKMLSFHPQQCEYRVRFNDVTLDIPIFISIARWNQTETLITLNYKQQKPLPKTFKIGVFAIILGALLTGFGYIIGLLTIGSFLVILATLFLLLFFVIIIFALSTTSSTGYKSSQTFGKKRSNRYYFDADLVRTQEDLMNYIVSQLHNNAELDIVQR